VSESPSRRDGTRKVEEESNTGAAVRGVSNYQWSYPASHVMHVHLVQKKSRV
jgi:hypothetical protein